MKAIVKSLLVLCVITVIECIDVPVLADSAGNQERGVVRDLVESQRSGGLFDTKRILREGTNAVPYLLPYLKDLDGSIRENVAIVLGEIADARAVLPLASMLQDHDSNVRRRALNAIHKINRTHQIKDQQTIAPLRSSLIAYAWKGDEDSFVAVLILGQLAGRECLPELNRLRDEATSLTKNGGGSAVVAMRTENACLKALAKLGDSRTRKEVAGLLESSDPKVRVRGIDVVQYVGKDMAAALVPLLQDERDALDVSPSMQGNYFLRVCDIAANALRLIKQPHLELRDQVRYTKEQREMLARTGSLEK